MEMLRECFDSLDGTKAVGIDGVNKEAYRKNLANNLEQLQLKIRQGSYHPQASRIVETPKASGGTRPLAISCFEDKLVQEAAKRIVERIYEPLFMDTSHGFRPRRDCHTALAALDGHLWKWECGAVLEIDLQKYFNSIPHGPLEKMLRAKISDERFLRLIIKLLKAPVLNEKGIAVRNEIGSPQGSISIAGDFERVPAPCARHMVSLDQYQSAWRGCSHGSLCGRCSVHLSKHRGSGAFQETTGNATRRVRDKTARRQDGRIAKRKERSRAARESRPSHANLHVSGFLHVWGMSVNGKTGKRFWRVKRRTCPVRFRKKLAGIKDYICEHRHEKALLPQVRQVVQGWLIYYGSHRQRKARL